MLHTPKCWATLRPLVPVLPTMPWAASLACCLTASDSRCSRSVTRKRRSLKLGRPSRQRYVQRPVRIVEHILTFLSLLLRYAKLDRRSCSLICRLRLPPLLFRRQPFTTSDASIQCSRPVQLHVLSLDVVDNTSTALNSDSMVVGWLLYAGLHGKTIHRKCPL